MNLAIKKVRNCKPSSTNTIPPQRTSHARRFLQRKPQITEANQMATTSYMIGFESFKVENCRSKGDHNDSDWLTLAVSTDKDVLASEVLLIGDNLHAGDQVRNIMAGLFEVDDDALVTVTFKVVNLAHSAADDQRKQAETIALALGSTVLSVLSGVGSVAAILSSAK